jgi:hypothetical protein
MKKNAKIAQEIKFLSKKLLIDKTNEFQINSSFRDNIYTYLIVKSIEYQAFKVNSKLNI